MSSTRRTANGRSRSGSALARIEKDPEPPAPPPSTPSKYFRHTDPSRGLWSDFKTLTWVVRPSSSFKMLLIPIVLYVIWELITPYIATSIGNPFAPLLFLSHQVPSSSPDNLRYQKGYLDLVFLAYHVIVWSFARQFITLYACIPLARWYGIKKQAKLARFAEQGYTIIYFGFMGYWGWRIMGQLPTWWFSTKFFWIDYPHWDMKPELKRYYLMQAAYWTQQLLILLLRLEKPRKDHTEFVAHHFVTLWLIGWSYLVNLTYIGNAVYMSMDIPDCVLGLTKILAYINYEGSKVVSFAVFLCCWTYFRHYLNLVMLWSVWTEFDLIPSMRWAPQEGAWLVWWMKYQIFVPILLLQFLNIFWYYLILRIAVRAFYGTSKDVEDDRSEDEDDDDDKED